MAISHQQSLADASSDARPPMLENGSYVSRSSRFMRYVDGKKELGLRVKRSILEAARNHDPLALVANSYASPSSSWSSQQYYVTHLPSVLDHDDDYQGEILVDEPKDTLSTAMMLLARAITQHFSTPTNNRLRTSSNTRNQANAGNQGIAAGNAENVQRNLRTTTNVGKATIVRCYNSDKDEAVIHLDEEENDFMLMSANGDDQLEELNASVIMMAHLQPADHDSDAEPKYDYDFFNEDNSKQTEHVNYAHDQKLVDFESLIQNVQTDAEKQHMANKEIKKENALLANELEACKKRIQDFGDKPFIT
ncbi:hypothetical protein Tco_0818891, partial [Tanacetum coccineum]